MAPKGRCRGRKARTIPPPAAARPPPPPSVEGVVTVADLTEELLRSILRRLAPADLLRAALACHHWRRAASRVLPRAPPLLGYFFHPQNTVKLPPSLEPTDKTHYSAVFVPLNAASPRLSLDLAPTAARGLSIQDVHLGLVLLLHHPRPQSLLPRILAIDPASRRRRAVRCPATAGAASGASSASPLSFNAVCLTVDGDLPRAWVTSVRDGDCAWRALPLAEGVVVDFDPWWFEARCIWVRGEGRRSDRGWVMEREMCMIKVLDTVPRLPKDTKWRMACTWLSDIDYARTGKVFVKTWGYGLYSFDTETGKLECLMMTDGKEYGDPMYAYTLSWPLEFLAPRD
nr:unnamed protein product [Digitaria exilis]